MSEVEKTQASQNEASTEEHAVHTKNSKRADWILLTAVLLTGLVLFAIMALRTGTGQRVSVRVDGTEVASYWLYSEVDEVICGYDGGENHLRISGGQAWIADADCPDALCVHMGKISKAGESVICLPHRLVVEVTGENS